MSPRTCVGLNKNGEDPKRVEILSAQFMMESVLVVRSKIGGDISSPRAKRRSYKDQKTRVWEFGLFSAAQGNVRPV